MTTPPRAPHRLGTLGLASLLTIALATGAFAGSPADAPAAATDKAKPAAGASGSSCCAPTGSAPAKSAVKRTVEDLSLAGLTLVDMDGREVALDEVLDTKRPVLLNFIFTTCTTICPMLSTIVSRVQAKLGDRVGPEVTLVSISVDPARDTPARLKTYAARHQAKPGWTWLTGGRGTVEQVLRGMGAYTPSFADHPPMVLVGDGAGGWTRLNGFPSQAVIVAQVDAYASAIQAGPVATSGKGH